MEWLAGGRDGLGECAAGEATGVDDVETAEWDDDDCERDGERDGETI